MTDSAKANDGTSDGFIAAGASGERFKEVPITINRGTDNPVLEAPTFTLAKHEPPMVWRPGQKK